MSSYRAADPSEKYNFCPKRAHCTRVRSSLRALREAIAKGDVKAANMQYRETVSTLDKSVQKGVLHSNTVSRYKSRLNARLKALATAKA